MALTQVKTLGIAADAVTGAKVADDQIDSEHYVAGSIDNEHLADDAVGLAEMAGLARGRLIVGDASGNPSALAAGSDNHVLTMDSNGDVGWEAAAAGGISHDGSTANGVLTYKDADEATVEANLTFDGNNLNQTIDADNEGFKQTAAGNHYIGNIANADITSGAGYAVYIQTGQWDGNQIAQMRFICGDDTSNKDDGDIAFYTSAGGSSSEVLRLTQEKNVEIADGNLKISTAGHGIDFSADANTGGMDNELLDDYEEGYFTFTMDSEGGDAWTSRAGYTKMRYIKIGNQVTFSGKYETNSSGGTPSGRLQITNLPFASIAATSDSSNTRAFHGYIRGMSSDDRMVMHLWWMGANSTSLLLHSFSNDYNGDMQSFAVAQLNSSTVWEGDVTGTYFTS